jgi:hypothetical protein
LLTRFCPFLPTLFKRGCRIHILFGLRYYSGVVFALVYYAIIIQNGLILIVMSAYNGKLGLVEMLGCRVEQPGNKY